MGLAERPDDGSLSARLEPPVSLVASHEEPVEVVEAEEVLADGCGGVVVEPVVVVELL